MKVVIDEMEGVVEPEPMAPEQQQQQSQCEPKPVEATLDKLRSEMSRLAQRELRLRAD